jgi:hypothetical protein
MSQDQKKEEESVEVPRSELTKWLEEIRELRRAASGRTLESELSQNHS